MYIYTAYNCQFYKSDATAILKLGHGHKRDYESGGYHYAKVSDFCYGER